MVSKTIVCLANSRKHNLRCVAGKELSNQGAVGGWVRPVGTPPERGIKLDDCAYQDKCIAAALDVIKIPVLGVDHHQYQSENNLIDPKFYWEKVGEFPRANMVTLADDPVSLWDVGYSSYSGVNDRVPLERLNEPQTTLYLIRPENVRFRVRAEGAAFNDHRKKVRAIFHYKNIPYGLAVTDFQAEEFYLRQDEGLYPVSRVSYFTVSMTEPHNGYAYKVIAAVF